MINVVRGDTIILEANLADPGGTAISDAQAVVTIVDAVGSTVYVGTASYTTDGTYQKYTPSAGWGYGPIKEYWKFTNSSGTLSDIIGNQFTIIGTATREPYVWPHELFSYYENIDSFFDGSELERVYDSYLFINQQLQNLGIQLPILKGTDGYYEQTLRDWNAYDSIYRLVAPRMASQLKGNDKEPWFDYYKKQANEIWDKFRTKKITISRLTSPGEAGIQPGTKVSGTLYGDMENNWEGYGDGFRGADYPRTWRVEMFGTGTAGEVGEGTYRWSKNGGISWEGTNYTSLDWTLLDDEVYVRFTRGTYTGGTTGLWTTNDVWQFNTTPIKNQVGGKGIAKSYR